MPSAAPLTHQTAAILLGAVGQRIRARRKTLRISAMAAAQAAGMSRVTLHRIEGGEASVTMGAYLNALAALGLTLDVVTEGQPAPAAEPSPAQDALPASIHLADYPALKRLAWHAPGLTELTPAEALSLYERNWRHLDREGMSPREQALLDRLVSEVGTGRLLV